MATKKNAITVSFARELRITAKEATTLEKAFKTDVAQVLGDRPSDDGPPLPEINIIRPISRTTTRPKTGAAKKAGYKKAKKR